MTDVVWVVSSCVMIIAVYAIRAIFGKKLGAGLRYALWALVLLRLLIPGTVFRSPASVENVVMKNETAAAMDTIKNYSSVISGSGDEVIGLPRNNSETAVIINGASQEKVESLNKAIKVRDVLSIIWYTGMALMTAYLIYVNTRFYLKLKDRRTPVSTTAPCRVYAVEGIESSCLFFNTIYVSMETAADPDKLKCVLAHELSHRRHGDGLFTVLRSAALVLHWYNPLVWLAAFSSRQDSELYADAGAVKSLGENRRENYGRTLIELSARPSVRASIACTATTMANNKHALKERVKNVAKRRRTGIAIAAVVLIISLASLGYTFLGSARAEGETTPIPAETDAASPTDAPAPTEPVSTEIPTETPAVINAPDEWFYDEAWEVVSELKKLYEFETSGIRSISRSDDWVTVVYGTDDHDDAHIEVSFAPESEDADAWSISRCYAYIPGEEDLAKIGADRNAFGSYFTYDVTEDELKEAGYELTGGEEDLDSAAAYVLVRTAGRFISREDDDLMRCLDAKPVRLTFITSDEGENHYTAAIAALPAAPRSFGLGFSEASTGWLYIGEEHPDCRYYQEINVLLTAVRNDDGSIRVFVEIPTLEV